MDPELKKSLAAIKSIFSEDEAITDHDVLQALAHCQDYFLDRVAENILHGANDQEGCFQVTQSTMESVLLQLKIDKEMLQEAKANVGKRKPKKRKVQRKFTAEDAEEQERLMTAARERMKKDKG